jgi:EPS-associated MarR family transcriptional regulator
MSLKENQNRENNEMEFNVLRSLYSNPSLTQRKLSSHLGVSLGSVNYCINALIDKGLVKVRRFKNSSTKQKYLYLLTAEGVVEKSRLTFAFLERKHAEYLRLQDEIESLKSELMDDKF